MEQSHQNQKQNQQLFDLQNSQLPQFAYTMPDLVDPNKLDLIIPADDKNGAIYLGNLEGARDIDLLRKLKIGAVLTTSVESVAQYSLQDVPFHYLVQGEDHLHYDISQHFQECIEFLEKARKQSNVLVHCFAGVSRSCSVVLAYLMHKYEWNLEHSLWFVKQKRNLVYPNPSFMKQLVNYDKYLEEQRKIKYTQIFEEQKQVLNKYQVSPTQIRHESQRVYTAQSSYRNSLQESKEKPKLNQTTQNFNNILKENNSQPILMKNSITAKQYSMQNIDMPIKIKTPKSNNQIIQPQQIISTLKQSGNFFNQNQYNQVQFNNINQKGYINQLR